ncbi:replicative DNA helicase [candidate division KSB1 bacterium]|nr:MAG: replicative DNA helicase [candidate division KSB1 bacterium]
MKVPEKPVKGEEIDRLPPQAIEAEMAVLGAMMIDNKAVLRAVEILDETNFYKSAHSKIFSSIVSLFEKNEAIDVLTVTEELSKRNQLDEIGGGYYLTECISRVTTAANVEHHSRIVLEKFLLRKLIEVATQITYEAYEAGEDAHSILDKSEQMIFDISEKRLKKGFLPIHDILHETFTQIESYSKRKGVVIGVPTGFDKLDEMTSGFQKSDLVVIAGRPSMGKTALSLNIARNAAVEEKIPVAIFSLEMSNYQIAMRMLCSEARIDSHRLRTGRLGEEDWQRLSMSAGVLAEAPIFIDDSATLNILELRAKARRFKAEKNIGMIIIDYLQLIQGPPNMESRQQEISAISRSLKALAKELEVPVVALSQLSRAVETRGGDRKPVLADLRESGAIEQDADVVLFIYRPWVYLSSKEKEDSTLKGYAEVIIGKQRNGPIGPVKLTFLEDYAKFENYAPMPVLEEPF